MKTTSRFISSTIKTAALTNAVLPWSRGTRRAAFVAKRSASTPPLSKTA